MKNIIKRDDRQVEFNPNKIKDAIVAAAKYNQIDLSSDQIDAIYKKV